MFSQSSSSSVSQSGESRSRCVPSEILEITNLPQSPSTSLPATRKRAPTAGRHFRLVTKSRKSMAPFTLMFSEFLRVRRRSDASDASIM